MAGLRFDLGSPVSRSRNLTASGSHLLPRQLLLSQQWEWPEARARQGGTGWPEVRESLRPAAPREIGKSGRHSKVGTVQGKGNTGEPRSSPAIDRSEHGCDAGELSPGALDQAPGRGLSTEWS